MEGYRRVTVLGPRSTVDVALPADVAVAELAPMLVELLAEPPSGAPAPWRLDGVAGAPLPASATLAQLGVLDGELLRIGPARPAPAPPRFDDVPEALAAAVAARSGGIDPVPALACLAASLVLSLGLTTLRTDPTWSIAGAAVGLLAALGLLVAVGRAGASTTDPDGAEGGSRPAAADSLTGAAAPSSTRAARVSWALAALPPAAAAGWLALPGPAGLLGAAVGAALAAFAGQAVLRIVAPPVLATLLVTLTTVAGSAFALLSGASAADVGTAVALLAVLAAPLAPRWALGLAGLNPAGELPDGAAALARGHLAGLVLAIGALAAGGAVLAATGPGWWGPAFGLVCCLVLALRARGFAEPVPARAQLVAAVLGAAGIAVAAPVPPGLRLAAAAVGLGGLLVVSTLSRPPLGPVARRTVDLTELALTALAVPLAAAALDLFALVRGS